MKACAYFLRAVRLRCPTCGKSPVFVPWHSLRCLRDWFTPLDGCPRCGYAYERETGYFLLAIWAVNYGLGSLLGLAIYLALEMFLSLSLPVLLFWVIAPVVVFNLLFARHAKAFFLALDHYFDPHGRDDAGDGDARAPEGIPPETAPPSAKSDPAVK